MGQVLEPHPLLAQPIANRHPDFIEKQFSGVLTFQADLFQQAPLGETGTRFFDADQGQLFGRRVDLGRSDHQAGVAAVGDKGLLAVDDVIITVAPRRGTHGAQITADARFTHGDHTDQFTTDHARQPLLLLLFAAIGNDVRRDDFRMSGEPHGSGIGASQLLDHHCRVAEVTARSAVFFRHGRAQQAILTGLQPDLLGHDAVFFPLMQVGHDFAVDETAGLITEHVVVFSKYAAHLAYSRSILVVGNGESAVLVNRIALVDKCRHRLLMVFGVMGQCLVRSRQLKQ
ncbi:hypothetical protein D3C76_602460 [compost metagenome]